MSDDSRVLIFSDLHCHPLKRKYERLQDCLDVLDWVFKTANERDISNILFCGDLFHDRQKIDVWTYQKVFEIFLKHSGDFEPNVYLLLGNHDLWHAEKWDISSVIPMRAIPGVTVVDRPCAIKVAGVEVGFLPYTHNPIEDLKKIDIKSKFKILCAHAAVDGAIWNVNYGTKAEVSIEHDGDMMKITPDVFDEYNQVFLGHYHAAQNLTATVEYVGSPLELNFGEANQKKHIIEYDLKTHDKKYIENKFSPKHLTFKEGDDILSFDLEKNFIRIESSDLASSDIIGLKNDIINAKVGSLEIKPIRTKIEDDKKSVADAKSILSSGDQMLETYVDCTDLAGLDRTMVLEIGRKCVIKTEDN
jgi:DNA repair exonuclease SbcCD nuclease subunit